MKKGLFIGLLTAGMVAGGVLLTRTAVAEDSPLGPKPFGGRHFGGRGPMLEKKAEMLGMSIDELTEELETKTWVEIMEEQGMSWEDWQAQMREKAQKRWQEMGLSEEEIAAREEKMVQRHAQRCEQCRWECGLDAE